MNGKGTSRGADRLGQLDGLRGIAAIVVVAHHFFLAFTPALQPIYARSPHWLYDTPLALTYNGSFAVAIFFVVSGFVVAQAGAGRKTPLWLRLVVRYLRLAIPAAASVLFAWVLLNAFKGAGAALIRIQPHNWLYQSYIDGTPAILDALWNGLVGAFWTGSSKYNNPLWTMRIELIGSAIIYAVYSFAPVRWRAPIAVVAGIASVALHQQTYLPFALGALLREAWAAGRLAAIGALPALIVAAVLGAPLQRAAMRFGFEGIPLLSEFGVTLGLPAILAAGLLVYAVLAGPHLGAILRTPIPHFLGRISFYVFLVHIPLIFSVIATLFVRAWPVDAMETGLLFVLLLALSLALAFAGTKLIDEPLTRRLSALRKTLVSPRTPDSPGPQ